MSFFKRSLLLTILALSLIGLLLSACASPAGTTTTTLQSTAVTIVPSPSPTVPASLPGPLILATTVVIGGQTQNILTNSTSQVLYYRITDTATAICSDVCAQTWLPLLFTGSGKPSSSSPLPGTLSVVNDANGSQVTYQGHPLYTYIGDKGPDDTHGQGFGGVWYVITQNVKPAVGIVG